MPRTPGSPNKPKPVDHLTHLTHHKLEPNVVDCADCGNQYPRVVEHMLCQNPKYWRHKCNCGRFLNPITQKWEHTTALELNKIIREHQKKCLEKY